MTDQENRILFMLIEPEGCWHEWRWDSLQDESQCKKCGVWCDDFWTCPDFTTPEWRIRLQEWLVENDNIVFYLSFVKWQWSNYDIIEGSRDKLWVMHIILNLAQEILDYLRTDEAKEKFGWVRCPGCDGYGVLEGQGGDDFHCKVCGVTGKIKAKWLVELNRE